MTVAIDLFRVLSSCSSMIMILSPMPTIIRACRTKTTGYASIVPLVSMLTNVHILMMFGYLTEQYFPVFSTFLAGDLICLVYVVLFYCYSHERSKAHRVFLLYGLPYVGVSTYALLGGLGLTHQTRHEVGNFVGYVSIVTGIIVFSSPLEKVGPVLTHRSAVFFNIHMIYAGTFNNLMWVVYSSLTQRWILFAPNAFSLVSGCFQITLYWIFHPSTHPMPELPDTTSNALLSVLSNTTSTKDLAIDVDSPMASPMHRDEAQRKRGREHSRSSTFYETLASPLEPLRSARRASNEA